MMGNACKCKPRRVVVMDRECHYSAFAGYRRTPSRYSLVRCEHCGAMWRTRANYVQISPDAPVSSYGSRAAGEAKTVRGVD